MGLEQLQKSLDQKAKSGNNNGKLKNTKSTKPMMERYRRRKINNYLEEIKFLVLSALNKEVKLYTKMEKADILDMAVQYIREVRKQSQASTTTHIHAAESNRYNSEDDKISSPSPSQPQNYRRPPCKHLGEIKLKSGFSNEIKNRYNETTSARETQRNESTRSNVLWNNLSRNQGPIVNCNTSNLWRPWENGST